MPGTWSARMSAAPTRSSWSGPEGALFFELQEAVWQFWQEVGIHQNAPADQMEMITLRL